MDLSTFIISVFCLVDDYLKDLRPLRERGPAPKLSDSEVLTIEIVGEFLGLDTDKAIHLFFKRHYGEWFQALSKIHRTTFARQAVNLWKVKEHLSGRSFSPSLLTTPHSPSATRCPCPHACSPELTVARGSREKPLSAKILSSNKPSTDSGCMQGFAIQE